MHACIKGRAVLAFAPSNVKKRSFLCHPVLLMHFIYCQFLTCYLQISPTLIIDVGFFFLEAEKNICRCAVSDSVFFKQGAKVRRKECAHPNYPNRAQWIGLTFCPLPQQTHLQVGARRSTRYQWKKGGTCLSRQRYSLRHTAHTDTHRLYLNTSSSCFLHSLWACAPGVFYLLVLDSCQTLIDGWYEYL